jgi:hypothetical protein
MLRIEMPKWRAMMRSCFLAVCLLAALAPNAVALDGTLAIPQLNKPASAATEGDALHAKYEAAWTRYEQAIAKVTDAVNKTLDDLFNKAADAGNLDLADMWDRKKKSLSDTKTLEWPSDGKAKTEWRRKYPAIEFPEEFSEAVKAAQGEYGAAVAGLKEDYEALVKEFTKDRNLGRAKQLRDEVAGLERKPVAAPERPKAVEIKPEAKPTVMALRELPRGYNSYPWVSSDGLRLYWQSGEGWERKIWQAARPSIDAPFGDQRRLFQGSDPSLTEDELEIFVTEKLKVMSAKRQTKDAAFGPLQAPPELAFLGKTVRPCVSPDGLMLWFDKVGDDEGTRWKNQVTLRVIRRNRAAPWGQPEEVRKDAIGMTNGFFIRPKEQYGIFPLKDAGFVFAVSKDAGQSFLNPARLEVPVDTPNGKQPFYCPATRELFFAGHPDAANGNESLIYVIKDLDLPSKKK